MSGHGKDATQGKALTSGDHRGRIRRDTGKERPHEGNRQAGVRRGRDRSGKVKGAGHSLLGLQREES